ncbi:hypothetical protein JCM3765_004797 [Sporobolomyces pararoseus]
MAFPYKVRLSDDFKRDSQPPLDVVDPSLEVYSSDKLLGSTPRLAPEARSRQHRILRFHKPQATLHANLREDLTYLTSFPYAGLTNQLLSMFKLVYLAKRLGRQAILPDLEPNHGEGGYARFSEFYDLDYFSKQTRVGIAEWKDLKTLNTSKSTEWEEIGCWGEGGNFRPVSRYNTQTTLWPIPIHLRTKFGIEPTTTYSGIQTIDSNNRSVSDWINSKVTQWFKTVENAPPLPDRHLLCFQNLFYTSERNLTSYKFIEGKKGDTVEVEGLEKNGEVWLKVGQYLRFTPKIDHIVDELLTSLLNSSHSPFIAIHLRQGDFLKLGRATNKTSEIKTKFRKGLDDLHSKLTTLPALSEIEVDKLPVLFATDSTDPKLLKELKRLNWILIDHEKLKTKEKHGGWYPGLLDSAVLSRAIGLVGTKQSTFSYLAERRIESWNGGGGVIVEL